MQVCAHITLQTPTFEYSHARPCERQVLTPYILIFFDNLLYNFTIYLYHNFIFQFNTTSFLDIFRDLFRHNIFLCNFLKTYFNTLSSVAPFQAYLIPTNNRNFMIHAKTIFLAAGLILLFTCLYLVSPDTDVEDRLNPTNTCWYCSISHNHHAHIFMLIPTNQTVKLPKFLVV